MNENYSINTNLLIDQRSVRVFDRTQPSSNMKRQSQYDRTANTGEHGPFPNKPSSHLFQILILKTFLRRLFEQDYLTSISEESPDRHSKKNECVSHHLS
ncbi:MAG: hypothetical protein NPIRA01_28430 [Nitrospirales bacterium]|nr:MAG: hypothetical protein NPIRA01_28430 [Nitrospirales bacterium]